MRYSHGLTLVGRVTEAGGAEIGVYRRDRDGRVCLDDLHTGLFDPAEAGKLAELLQRAAMPGQDAAAAVRHLDPATRPAADDEIVSPSCNYEVVQDARGEWVDVGADLGQVEVNGHKLPLAAARELAAGLAASISHCEWWLAENAPGQEGRRDDGEAAEADCGCGFGPDRCRAYEDGDWRA